MKKAFRALTAAAGALYGRMAVEFFADGLVLMGLLAVVVCCWYLFGMMIVRRLEGKK